MSDLLTAPRWQDMDAETLAAAYSPNSALDGPIDPFIAAYVDKSKAAYFACPDVVTIPYDYRVANTTDFVSPNTSAPAPLRIFIHGRYWQERSKRESFFPALDTFVGAT